MTWRARLNALIQADPVQVPRDESLAARAALQDAASILLGLAEALEAVRKSKAPNDWASRQAVQVRMTLGELDRSAGIDLSNCVTNPRSITQWRSALITAFHPNGLSGEPKALGSVCPLSRMPLDCVEREGSRVDQDGLCPGCDALTGDLLRLLSATPEDVGRRQRIQAVADHGSASYSRSPSVAADVLIEFVQMAARACL